MPLNTKQRASWRLPLIAVGVGVAIGYWVAGTGERAADRPAAATSTPDAPDTAQEVARPAGSPALAVNLSRRVNSPLATRGVLIGRRNEASNRLLLPLETLYQTTGGVIRTGDRPVALGPVRAVHSAAGLAVLDIDLNDRRGLIVPDSGALYLGLELQALTTGSTLPARVETAARQRHNGQTVYGVLLNSPPPAGLTALVLPGTDQLAGLLTGRRLDDGLYEAVDAYALLQAEPALNEGRPVSLDRFSEVFFNTTDTGLEVRFFAAAEDGHWQRAIETGRQLQNSHINNAEVERTLEQAYLHQIRAALERRNHQTALRLVNDARASLTAGTELLHAHAAVLHADNQPAAAAEVLLEIMNRGSVDQAGRERARERLAGLLSGERIASQRKQTLLQRAIDIDTTHAPYHAELGDMLYEQQRYAGALSRWSYAAQLDPALERQLQGRMDDARNRMQPADGVVVPLLGNGHSYFVDARINRREQRLLLDTGASFSAISSELARSLGITYSGDTRRIRLSTANGIITAPVVTLDQIDLNGAVVRNLNAVVLERIDGAGVLGLNFLNHFDIDINQAESRMILRR